MKKPCGSGRGPLFCEKQTSKIMRAVHLFSLGLVTSAHAFSSWCPRDARTLSLPSVHAMKRPLLDRIASTLFELETSRVNASSVTDDKGRVGEPMEWSEGSSLANKFSEVVASNSLGYQFKQWVADIVAGDFDAEVVNADIDLFINENKVAMFSFTTCPFCRRAKDVLDSKGIEYKSMELDELDGNKGNEIRALLGKRTKRTSVPSIFVRGAYIGGCNDGPGLIPLAESGKLDQLLLDS